MTDKEQIIINGVDVSECEFFDGSHLCKCDKTIIDEHKKLKNIFSVKYVNCRDNYNCYFKQLARKTQECEELKKQVETSEKWRIKAESLNEKLDLKNTYYRKALEEIEKELEEDVYCESQECGCDDFEECLNCVKTQILNIISKVKGKE